MKIKINNEDIIINLQKNIINFNCQKKEELEENIKKIILKLRKKYNLSISGYYKVNVYQNNKFGIIIEIKKLNDLDFFPDLIDLKISIYYDSNIFLMIDDYFLLNKNHNIYFYNNKYYLDIDNLDTNEIINLSEFFNYIYGDELVNLKKNLKRVVFDRNNILC